MKNKPSKRVFLTAAGALILLMLAASTHVSSQAGAQQAQYTGVFGLVLSIFEVLARLLFSFLYPIFWALEASLKSNPQIYPLKIGGALTVNGRIYQNIFIILAPLYAMTVLVLGAYMVFMSHSPQGRAQAKMMLDKIILSMIIVPASPAIYEMLLQTSEIITRSVINTVLAQSGATTVAGAFNHALSVATAPLGLLLIYNVVAGFFLVLGLGIILLYVTLLAVVLMWFRYLIVLVFAFLFPLVLFMYLFQWTRHIGAMFLKFTLVWIFTPVISAIFLAVAVFMAESTQTRGSSTINYGSAAGSALLSDLSSIILTPIVLTVCMMLTWIAPLVMSGLMRFLGGLVSMVGMILPGPYGMALAAAGGVMQGKSMAALATVAIKHAGAKSLKALKSTKMGKKFAAGAQKAGRVGSARMSRLGGRIGKRLGGKFGQKWGRRIGLAVGRKMASKVGINTTDKAKKEAKAKKDQKKESKVQDPTQGRFKRAVGATVGAAKAVPGAVKDIPGATWRGVKGSANWVRKHPPLGQSAVTGAAVGAAARLAKNPWPTGRRLKQGAQRWRGHTKRDGFFKGTASAVTSTRGWQAMKTGLSSSGLKNGFKNWNAARKQGGGSGGGRSFDMQRMGEALGESHGIDDKMLGKLDKMGVKSNADLLKTSSRDLEKEGFNSEQISGMREHAQTALNYESYFKQNLASPGRAQREAGVDMMDNMDIQGEEGM